MKQINHTHLHGSCACGTFSFETKTIPVARFVCHCLYCQDFTGKPFSDVTVLMSQNIKMKGIEELTHKKYRLPPNLNRARCSKCGKPAMETMGLWPLQLVFVPSENFDNIDLLPPIKIHAFWNRRVVEIEDDLPKYSHYWPSQIAIVKTILGF